MRMKNCHHVIAILLSLLAFPLFAKINLEDLKAGDVLLISLNCFECRMIESETNSSFSHSGVVVVDQNGQKKIAQSLGRLDAFTYEAFTKNKTPQTSISVYRPKELKNLKGQNLKKLEFDMYNVFIEKLKMLLLIQNIFGIILLQAVLSYSIVQNLLQNFLIIF